jgi:carboxypeptidase family protein/TonB-dependent receptor-like protein
MSRPVKEKDMRRLKSRHVAAVIVGVLFATPALAQTTGQLRGLVTDQKGMLLPGVVLAVECASQGVSGRGAVTDAAGAFQVPGLPPGRDYSVRASLPGFASLRLTDIVISAGQVSAVRLTLVPEAAVRERVEVRARPNIVDLDQAATQTQVSSEFIDALPLLGRNFQDILTLAPGVTDVDGDGNPNIHGSRDTDLKTLVDGVNTTDPLTGKIGAQLNIESIQEVEIKTSGATAEYSRAQGGFANVITKSGGNDFEGTFKFFWRGSALDGDGAGIDDPRLHAGVGESGLRQLRFNDYLPFLSLGGPLVKDHAWYFVTGEYIQKEDPVNALNTAFVKGLQEYRMFAKMTWQATTDHRLSLSLNYDPQEYLNEGLNSFTREETGFTTKAGGTLLTMRDTAILNPMVSLETSVSNFAGRPALVPNLDRDGNGNGILYNDWNGNGVREAWERDSGEDYDGDGVFDVFEVPTGISGLKPKIDYDGDKRVTPRFGCEGRLREDTDCDGHLDQFDEDLNHDGIFEPLFEDLDGDRRFDRGTEDRNHNGILDDTPRPTSLYPYGSLAPQASDRDYTIGKLTGVVSGPYFKESADHRGRLALRQDLSVYVPGTRGSHDLKLGWIAEREQFTRTVKPGTMLGMPEDACTLLGQCAMLDENTVQQPQAITALIPTSLFVDNDATSVSTGLYVQDNFKPVSNLSVGVGLRFDREMTDSFGYSFFDPASERALFDRLSSLSGAEIGHNDYQQGNNDGLDNFGILADPIFASAGEGGRQAAAPITEPIRIAAIARLTRHHSESSFESDRLGSLFPDIFSAGGLNVQRLRELGVSLQQREKFQITNNNLAPRLSVSWDPWQDGRTKLFATWGRYYDRLFLSTIVGEEGPDYLARYYSMDPDGLAPVLSNTQFPVQIGAVPDHLIGKAISRAAPSATQVDRGLKTPFSDEWTLGFQREISPEVALSVTYINRRYRDQIQDVDANHTLRFNPLTGEPVDLIGNIQLLFGVPTPGDPHPSAKIRFPDGRPDLYVLNPFFNQVMRIGNRNEAYYRGIEVQLTRRLSRRWQMQGSYTYSRAVGAAEDFQSRLGNDPSTIESEFGYLDYDQRHVVKMYMMTYLPHDWQFGSSLTWASGLPYSVISRFFALDNEDYFQYRTVFGSTVVDPVLGRRFKGVSRNSERNDATLDVNVNLRKTFVVGRTSAAAFLEVFNLLNRDDLRILSFDPNRGEPAPGSKVPGDIVLGTGDPLVARPTQIEGERRFGRRFQVGVQFQF